MNLSWLAKARSHEARISPRVRGHRRAVPRKFHSRSACCDREDIKGLSQQRAGVRTTAFIEHPRRGTEKSCCPWISSPHSVGQLIKAQFMVSLHVMDMQGSFVTGPSGRAPAPIPCPEHGYRPNTTSCARQNASPFQCSPPETRETELCRVSYYPPWPRV